MSATGHEPWAKGHGQWATAHGIMAHGHGPWSWPMGLGLTFCPIIMFCLESVAQHPGFGTSLSEVVDKAVEQLEQLETPKQQRDEGAKAAQCNQRTFGTMLLKNFSSAPRGVEKTPFVFFEILRYAWKHYTRSQILFLQLT
jgi:hypothetical protein